MKICRICSYDLSASLGEQTFWSSQCAFNQRRSLLVRIETDNGFVGWGEGGQYGPNTPVQSLVHDVFAPMLLGRNPHDSNVLWESAYASVRDYGRKGSAIEALSAVDMALWDIRGKIHNLSIAQLLGGRFRDEVTCYATGGYYRGREIPEPEDDLQGLKEELETYILQGFRAVKVKIGLYSLEQDLRRLRTAREVLGETRLLMVDANHAYGRAAARRMARSLAELNVTWFEEPVVPEDRDGYLQLRQLGLVPVAGGECEYTRYGFAKWLAAEALDICQPDLCCAGGISEVKRIADMANAMHVQCIPHVWGSGVALAAGLQLVASLPSHPHTASPIGGLNDPLLEWDCSPNPLRTELVQSLPKPRAGRVQVPKGPGLGVEVDVDAIVGSRGKRESARHRSSSAGTSTPSTLAND